jgi:hypothetical protein
LRANAVRGNNHKIYLRTDGFRVTAINANEATNQVYSPGHRLIVSVTFAGVVIVQGTPRLGLNANALLPTYALYKSGSGTSTLEFEYIVVVGDSVNVLEASSRTALELPTGSMITDATGMYVTLRLGAPLLPGSLYFNYRLAIASSLPIVVRVYTPSNDNTEYGVGDDLLVAVQFSRRIAVGAPPSLLLGFIAGTKSATYVSGDQSDTLLFTYRIVAGDAISTSTFLNYNDINALLTPAPGLFAWATTLTIGVNTLLPPLTSAQSLGFASSRVHPLSPVWMQLIGMERMAWAIASVSVSAFPIEW